MGPGEISSERADTGIEVITLSGEHDLHTAPELSQRLEVTIDEGVPVVVDLSSAAFIDSSILGAVLDARRRAHEKGLGFCIALSDGAQPVRRVLEVTGLDSILPVHPTRAVAIEEARGGPPKK